MPFDVATITIAKHSGSKRYPRDAIKANAASAVRADANGSGTFPGVPPGRYFLMISTRHKNQALVWGQAVQLKAGQNSITLDEANATSIN